MTKKVVVSIQKLNQSDFKSKIIEDTDYIGKSIDRSIGRQALFQCSQCGSNYSNNVKIEKAKKEPICRKCYEKIKHTIFQPLNQNDYKAEILFDIEYETKNRMNPRKAIFKCPKCNQPFLSISEPQCNQCNIQEPELPINTIQDLGKIKTSKHRTYHFAKFKCPQCNNLFIRNINRTITICDKCIANKPETTISRLYRIWTTIKKDNPQWNNFKTFENWAVNNGYNDTLSLTKTNTWENNQNQSNIYSTNTLGYRGIAKSHNKYRAQISVNNIRYHIGSYPTKEEAALAYDQYIDDNNLYHTKNFE